MEPLSKILLAACLILASIVGWLLWIRAASEGTRRALEAERDAADSAAGAARHTAESERLRADESSARLEEALRHSAALARDLEHEQRRSAEALDDAARTHDASLRHTQEKFEQQIRAERAVLAEREQATARLLSELEARARTLDEAYKREFGGLAAGALREASQSFLHLAKEQLGAQQAGSIAEMDKRRTAVDDLLRPIREVLTRTDEKLGALESARGAAYAGLVQQVKDIQASNSELREETGRLVRALSRPEIRGRYGEIQLRRIAELAGMTSYCDFTEQVSTRDADGRLLRPDMIVRLPNERVIVVDAKTNTDAYLQAVGARSPEEQSAFMDRFARQVDDQVQALSRKGYWKEFSGSPDFVVMFVPGDQFLDAALQRQGDLLERAAERGVILASPSTLIGLLRAVAVGWREKNVEQRADELLKLGKELHDRAAVMLEHLCDLGNSLTTASDRYNKVVKSMETRLLPTLRRFEESGAAGERVVETPPQVTVLARLPSSDGPLFKNGTNAAGAANVPREEVGPVDAEDGPVGQFENSV